MKQPKKEIEYICNKCGNNARLNGNTKPCPLKGLPLTIKSCKEYTSLGTPQTPDIHPTELKTKPHKLLKKRINKFIPTKPSKYVTYQCECGNVIALEHMKPKQNTKCRICERPLPNQDTRNMYHTQQNSVQEQISEE